jgi:hypothetical protein
MLSVKLISAFDNNQEREEKVLLRSKFGKQLKNIN